MTGPISHSSESDGPLILFAGGGTGGHLSPGLAVAEEFRRRLGSVRIAFVGSGREIERRMIEPAGYPLETTCMPSSLDLRRQPLRSLSRGWSAWRTAHQQLKANRPHLIVGLGGFASFPACLAARSHGIPLALLEQNVVPGRSVRFLARRAGLVCGSFEETAVALRASQNYVVTGNPVRSAIAGLHSRAGSSDDRQTLLILGGSQGAESLNTAVLGLLGRGVLQRWGGPIVHQTGLADEARVREGYANAGVAATVSAFIDDLQPHYDAAALAIARAGATTLAELACAGCPAILLPYPHAADNHQLRNAQWYARQGAAIVVEQITSADATAAHLASAWEPLSANPGQRITMRLAMARTARPDAASAVVETLLNRLWGTGPVS